MVIDNKGVAERSVRLNRIPSEKRVVRLRLRTERNALAESVLSGGNGGKCVFAFEDGVMSAVAPVIGRKRGNGVSQSKVEQR